MKSPVQDRAPSRGAPAPVLPAVRGFEAAAPHPGLLRAPTGGAPLPALLQRKMSGAFGHDFRSVRVHQDAQAESIDADAFARGEHLHFRPGLYAPHTPAGLRLLGHELAHVVQQRARRVSVRPGGGIPLNADPRLEGEAERMGARAAAAPAPAVAHTPTPDPAAYATSGSIAPIQPMGWARRAAQASSTRLASMLALAKRTIHMRVVGGQIVTAPGPKHKPVPGYVWGKPGHRELLKIGEDAVGTGGQWKTAGRGLGLQGEHGISQKTLGIIATKGRALSPEQHKRAVRKAGLDSPAIPLEPKQHMDETAAYGGRQHYVDRVGKHTGKRPEIHAMFPHYAAVQATSLVMRHADHLLVGASIKSTRLAAEKGQYDPKKPAPEIQGDPMKGGVTFKLAEKTAGEAIDQAHNDALKRLAKIPRSIRSGREEKRLKSRVGKFLTIGKRLMKAKMKAKRKKGPKPN
jgi:hypothetical protein